MKKSGGIIKNWQLHHLSKLSKKNSKAFLKHFPNALLDPGPVLFTGTVETCPSGKWDRGFHMKSSYIVSIDREKGIIETMNTIYKTRNEGNDVLPDLGDGILGILY